MLDNREDAGSLGFDASDHVFESFRAAILRNGRRLD
jgi:hypothetical protein